MKKRTLLIQGLLRLAELAVLLAGAYPLSVCFLLVFMKEPDLSALPPLLGSVVLGGAMGFWLHAAAEALAERGHVRLLNLLRWLLIAAPAAAACVLLRLYGAGIAVFGAALTGAMYAAGSWLWENRLKVRVYIAVLLMYVFSAILIVFLKHPLPMNGFVWTFAAASLAAGLVLNYANIDFLMQRRSHSKANLPGKVRRHNLLVLAGFSVPALLLILLRGTFIGAVSAVFRAFGDVLKRVLLGIGSLLLRFSDRVTGGAQIAEQPDGRPSSGPSAMDMLQELTEDDGSGSAVQTSIVIVIAVIGAIFFLAVFGRPLLRLLTEKLTALFLFLRRKLSYLSRRRRSDAEEELYVDVEEAITAEGAPELVPAERRALRRWRRALGEYKKLPDGREKYLTGYRLTVEGLTLHGVSVQPSDTPLDILAKAEPVLTGDGYAAATACCNGLLYAGTPPELAEQALQESLDAVQRLRSK